MTHETNPLSPLKNPYPVIDRVVQIKGAVSPEDFRYFKTLFPCSHGLMGAVVSTFFHHVITELKRIDAELVTSGEPKLSGAWAVHHTNHSILRQIVERSTVGGTTIRDERGTDSPGPNVGRTVSSICSPLQSATAIPPNQESGASEGGSSSRSEAEDPKNLRTITSLGTPQTNPVEKALDALDLLRAEGILPP